MSMLLLSIHPVIQFSAILLILYVFYLGLQRFRFNHLHQKQIVFKWQRHVLLGKIALGVLLLGAAGGMTMVYTYWHRVLMVGIHAQIGLVIIPLAIFGLVSGWYMDSKKKKRKVLPLVHGLNNLVLLLLALSQIFTGWDVYQNFVLGG